MRKILFSGELPPKSVHGVSLSNEINIRLLKKRFEIIIDQEVVDFRFHGKFDVRKSFNFIKRVFRIFRFSLIYRFDYLYIVLSTSTVGAIKTLILISIFKLFNIKGKIIIHIHRGDLERFINVKPFNAKIFSLIEKLASSFIVLSAETKKFLLKQSRSKVYILENTVTPEVFFDTPKGIRKNKYDFIFISNYIEEKGILILLEAFAMLPSNYILNCYGSFTNLRLKSKIEQYGRYGNIFINDVIQGVEKFERIHRADALILPSFNEGKPLILLEAMSVGTPFIATHVGYIGEIPYENYPYLYEDCNSVESLLSKVHEFVSSSADNLNISKLLKERYLKEFSNEIHAIRLNEIFK